jgi:hypothetical protein
MLIQEICRECSFLHLRDCDDDTEPAIRRNGGEVNVLVDTGHLFQADLATFFGPQFNGLEDVFIVVPADATWAHVLAGIGCFPSVSQARKNGWNKPIEDGFTDTFKVGKAHRKFITALRPTESPEDTSIEAVGLKIEHGVAE